MDISHAINALIPVGSASWVLHGNDYSGLDWHSDNEFPKPTEAEVNAKLAELMAAEPLRLLRLERNKLLAETDWWAVSDRTMTNEERTYRQALRDLPANTTDSANPVWPTKP